MHHFKFLLSMLLFPCLMAAAAQDPRQDSGTSDVRESKPGIQRTYVGIEQLTNARQILHEATDLALRLEPSTSFCRIGALWVELDRPNAGEKLESLLNFLRSGAQRSTTLGDYERFAGASVSLLSTFAVLHTDRAVQLAREWPEPPRSQNKFAQGIGEPFLPRFLKNYLLQIAHRDPDKALSLLGQWGASSKPDYGLRGRLANELSGRGRRVEAIKLIDQAITDFRQEPAPGAVQSYADFLSQIASVDSERFKNGFMDLTHYGFQPGSRVSTETQNRIGNEILRPTCETPSILSNFLALQNGRETLLKLLETLPELKAKIDRLGGIDSFFDPRLNPGRQSTDGSSHRLLGHVTGSVGRRAYFSPPPGSMDSPSQLMHELRGKTVNNRAMVRNSLTQAAGTPERLGSLIMLAQMANHEDPDLSSVALQVASGLVARVQPLHERSMMLQSLVRTYRRVEKGVDPNLIMEGFLLADQIREEEKARVQPGTFVAGTALTQADQLEMTLVSEYARDNFDAAVRYVRSMPDNQFKLAVLTEMAQTLR